MLQRSGQFQTCDDILYKRSNFSPLLGGDVMKTNLIDVMKALFLWEERKELSAALFGEEKYVATRELLGDLSSVVVDEYIFHETGHGLGLDVETKQSSGYFAWSGRTAWPLVFVEELRADLGGFGLAAELLPPERAARVFLYTLFLRLAVHAEGLSANGRGQYGLIPFLLFSLLRELEYLQCRRGKFQVATMDVAQIVAVMRHCAEHADAITQAEVSSPSLADAALGNAAYLRRRLMDKTAVAGFEVLMDQAVGTCGVPRN